MLGVQYTVSATFTSSILLKVNHLPGLLEAEAIFGAPTPYPTMAPPTIAAMLNGGAVLKPIGTCQTVIICNEAHQYMPISHHLDPFPL